MLQWTPPERKTGLLEMASSMQCDVSDVNVQLAYFREEMTEMSEYKGVWQALKNMYTYTEVSDWFLEEVEEPGAIETQYSIRRGYAATIYNAISSL